MKVSMLTTVDQKCGIAAYSADLVHALREIVDVTVEPIEVGKQTQEHYREVADRLNAGNVVHIQHEHTFWGGILPGHSAFWNLRYMIKRPTVITAHTTTSLAALLRVKQERSPLRRIAKEVLIRRRSYRDSVEVAPFMTGRCIVHTRAARDELIARGAKAPYVHVIPAGVPPVPPAPTGGAAFRERFGLGDRRVVSLFGFVTPNKGIELTLDVLTELQDDIVLVIAGGARVPEMEPYVESVRARAVAQGLGDRVVITGYLSDEDVAEAMAATEVVVVPHTLATGSYSVTIPLAHGKPIVASDQDCFKEIQERVPCLRLFRSGDAAHYTACLKGVLNNEVGRAEMSERALRYAHEYDWGFAARETVKVYRSAMRDG